MSRPFHKYPLRSASLSLLVTVHSSVSHRPSRCITLASSRVQSPGEGPIAPIAPSTRGRSSGWMRSDRRRASPVYPSVVVSDGLPYVMPPSALVTRMMSEELSSRDSTCAIAASRAIRRLRSPTTISAATVKAVPTRRARIPTCARTVARLLASSSASRTVPFSVVSADWASTSRVLAIWFAPAGSPSATLEFTAFAAANRLWAASSRVATSALGTPRPRELAQLGGHLGFDNRHGDTGPGLPTVQGTEDGLHEKGRVDLDLTDENRRSGAITGDSQQIEGPDRPENHRDEGRDDDEHLPASYAASLLPHWSPSPGSSRVGARERVDVFIVQGGGSLSANSGPPDRGARGITFREATSRSSYPARPT